MNSLYESILASTSSGKEYIVKKEVEEWIEAILQTNDIKDYKIKYIKNRYYLFLRKTYKYDTDIIISSNEAYKKMPKLISFIFVEDPYSTEEWAPGPTNLLFENLRNLEVDLSKLVLPKEIPGLSINSSYNIYISECTNTRVKGINIDPSYLSEYSKLSMIFRNCKNCSLENTDLKDGSLHVLQCGEFINNINRCKMGILRITRDNLKDLKLKEKTGNSRNYCEIDPENTKRLYKLERTNSIEKIILFLFPDDLKKFDKEYYKGAINSNNILSYSGKSYTVHSYNRTT